MIALYRLYKLIHIISYNLLFDAMHVIRFTYEFSNRAPCHVSAKKFKWMYISSYWTNRFLSKHITFAISYFWCTLFSCIYHEGKTICQNGNWCQPVLSLLVCTMFVYSVYSTNVEYFCRTKFSVALRTLTALRSFYLKCVFCFPTSFFDNVLHRNMAVPYFGFKILKKRVFIWSDSHDSKENRKIHPLKEFKWKKSINFVRKTLVIWYSI